MPDTPIPTTDEDISGLPRITVTPGNPALPVELPDYNNYYNNYDPSLVTNATLMQQNPSPDLGKGFRRLLGIEPGEDRYQLWPERMVRSGFSLPGEVYRGETPIETNGQINPEVIERSLDTAGLAGLGGLSVGATDATLGSAPFLRPALKYEGKIYKGKVGEEHPVPDHLRADFEQKALSGEDINSYNFGFVNHKGQFLDRTKALDYAIEEGLLPPDMAKYGALTSTMLNENRMGTAIAANKPFYSTLENTIANAKVQKATPEQWQAYLKNQPGVKPEELEFSGINTLNGSVTKEQLLQHVQDNGIKLGEVWKGDKQPNPRLIELDNEARRIERTHDMAYDPEARQRVREIRNEISNMESDGIGRPKYSSYQLPGGNNYRELLLTKPSKEQLPPGYKSYKSDDGTYGIEFPDGMKLGGWKTEEDAIRSQASQRNNPQYKSSHWDEPNVLAHIRMNDRFIPEAGGPSQKFGIKNEKPVENGLKDLHIEEIQSDWHQAGRKQGYKGQNLTPEDHAIRDRIRNNKATLEDNLAWENGVGDKFAKDTDSSLVPNAPFKKTWDELAFKRVLKEAVDNGYDSVSWTPGEAQAARYDLSKHVDKVNLVPQGQGMSLKGEPEFKYRVDAFKNNNKVIEHFAKDENEVASIVGKEVAQKLFENRNQHGAATLAGQDLSIGGSGMKSFYDKMLVDKANALVKKMGGKVEYENLPTRYTPEIREIPDAKGQLKYEIYNTKNNEVINSGLAKDAAERVKNNIIEENKKNSPKIPLIRITPQMREKIGKEGFPLFSTGVPTFTPSNEEPEFKKSPKLTPVDYKPTFPGEVI